MREFARRLRAAWAVMRGKPVIRGVEIRYGEVCFRHRDDLYLSDSTISGCQVLTRGPIAFRVGKGCTVENNEGTALVD